MNLSTTNNRGRKWVHPTRLILSLTVVAMAATAGFPLFDTVAWERGQL